MKVYGFVGPSGTGKSHRAIEVARREGVECILDDGLLIRGNRVLAGVSAKREASRIASIRRALFTEQPHADMVKAALEASGVKSVMILGTSVNMVNAISQRLGLPGISMYIDIADVASQDDIDAALAVRSSEGKHVIPAPALAIKKDFPGYFLTPLRRLVRRGKKVVSAYAPAYNNSSPPLSQAANDKTAAAAGRTAAAGPRALPRRESSSGEYGERTVVRPTFSYLGGYTISKAALIQLAGIAALKTAGVAKALDISVEQTDYGLDVSLSLCIKYGVKIHDTLDRAVKRLRAEIDRQTALYVREVKLIAKSLEQ